MPPSRRRDLLAYLRQLGLAPAADLNLEPIEEALTHSSAGLARNHERLEFLGDAVLRLAASLFLQEHHPGLRVGQCSSLRAQLVSDRWLAELAEQCGLGPMLHLGPLAVHDRAGRATVLAETCEALVGGIYEAWGGAGGGSGGGLEPVLIWLTPHWQRATAELLADPLRHNWKSALQEWSQAQKLGLPHYACSEVSQVHADPRRFHCQVRVGELQAEGWGASRRQAEQAAAAAALALRPAPDASAAG
jgi:ribonuclease-3